MIFQTSRIFVNPEYLKVFAPWAVWYGPRLDSVYLTFDDGPDPKWTSEVLYILNDKNSCGTFFLNGHKVLQYQDTVKEIHSVGHLIGNHGFSHQSLSFKPKRFVMDEIIRTNASLQNLVGYSPRLFRPPYGSFDLRFKPWLEKNNMKLVMWNLMTFDFNAQTVEQLMNTINRFLQPKSILVFHDGHANSHLMVRTLPSLIDFIHHQGYSTCYPLLTEKEISI